MNERIRELAKQANDAVSGNSFSMVKYNEKFAQLIVNECIDIAYREGDNVAYLALHFGGAE